MKLYMLLLGAEAPGRNIEQHDFFFGIANNLKDLVPEIKAFWPEAGNSLHIDGWREVNRVEDWAIRVVGKNDGALFSLKKLFFLNLGGYTGGVLEEQHYTVLTIQDTRKLAIQTARKNTFFKTNSLKGIATAHIDEKYGVDVDSIHQVEELLSASAIENYRLVISEGAEIPEDQIHLGYFKLDKIK